MPAILRIFLTKKIALVYDITPYAQDDVVGVGRAGSRAPIHRVNLGNGMWVCNIMRWCRWRHGSVLRTSVRDYYYFLSVFLRYEAYASRPTIRIQNTMLVIIVCVFNTAAGNDW